MNYRVHPHQATHIISVCTGIVHLACWLVGYQHARLARQITSLVLDHMSIDFITYLGLNNLPNRAWCKSITHLTLVNYIPTREHPTVPYLGRFPRLTHFCITFFPERNYLQSVFGALGSCSKLQAMVLVCPRLVPDLYEYYDPRCVNLPQAPDAASEWEASRSAGDSQWSLAEGVIEARAKQSAKQ